MLAARVPPQVRDHPDKCREVRPKALALLPSFGQQLLDIAVTQGEANIEPDGVLDDLGREAMTAIAERSHL